MCTAKYQPAYSLGLHGTRPPFATFDRPMGGLKATCSTGLSGGRFACVTEAISVAVYLSLHDPLAQRPPPLVKRRFS